MTTSKRALVSVATATAAVIAIPFAGGSASASTQRAGAGASEPSCAYSQLRIRASQDDGATGHISFRVHFINKSDLTCTMYAYPGAEALNRHGKFSENAVRTNNGFSGGVYHHAIPVVHLRTGQEATAVIEGTDMPVGGATRCKSASAFRVTPPNTTESTLIERKMPECSPIEVHPVVKGDTGILQ